MKKKLTEELFINKWLEDYHNTSIKEVEEKYPEWMEDTNQGSREFYKTYAVSQVEHDEWYRWAIDVLAKHYRLSKKRARRAFWLNYLNVAPSIKEYIHNEG